jgi:hypothetical protein
MWLRVDALLRQAGLAGQEALVATAVELARLALGPA